MKTPNFTVISAVTLPGGKYGETDLQPGEFVRPIQLCYIPKHVIEDSRWKYFDVKTEIFCYTRKGIVPLKRDNVRET